MPIVQPSLVPPEPSAITGCSVEVTLKRLVDILKCDAVVVLAFVGGQSAFHVFSHKAQQVSQVVLPGR